MTDKFGCVLITGPPGIGKTTLVHNVCQELIHKHKIECCGFYTEEVRHAVTRERIGFDVVTLNQKRGILARSAGSGAKGPFVGKYCVHVKDFEDLTLPLLANTNWHQHKLLVLDEIGKMELKSRQFEAAVINCLEKNTALLATVPYKSHPTLALVEKLKNDSKAKIIVVTKENRNNVHREIIECVLQLLNNKSDHLDF